MKLMMKLPPPRSIEYSHLSDSLNGIITLRNGDLTPGVIPRIMVDGQTLQNSGLSDNGSNISSTLPLAFGANAAGLGPAASPWIGRAAGGSNLYLNTPSGSSFAWMFGNVVAGLNTSAGTMFGANASPGARIESRITSGAQLRISFDSSHYSDQTVDSGGEHQIRSSSSKYRFQRFLGSDYLQLDVSAAPIVRSNTHLYLYPQGTLTLRGLDATTGTQLLGAGGALRVQVNDTGIGFFAKVPVAQQAHLADPTDLAELVAWAASLNAQREAYGLCAAS